MSEEDDDLDQQVQAYIEEVAAQASLKYQLNLCDLLLLIDQIAFDNYFFDDLRFECFECITFLMRLPDPPRSSLLLATSPRILQQ